MPRKPGTQERTQESRKKADTLALAVAEDFSKFMAEQGLWSISKTCVDLRNIYNGVFDYECKRDNKDKVKFHDVIHHLGKFCPGLTLRKGELIVFKRCKDDQEVLSESIKPEGAVELSKTFDSLASGVLKASSSNPVRETLPSGKISCCVCAVLCQGEGEWVKHANGKKHVGNLLLRNLKEEINTLISDKYDVSVHANVAIDCSTGTISIVEPIGAGCIDLFVENNNEKPVLIRDIVCVGKKVNTVELDFASPSTRHLIGPGSKYTVSVKYSFDQVGTVRLPIMVLLSVDPQAGGGEGDGGTDFEILRFLEFRTKDDVTSHTQPCRPYSPLAITKKGYIKRRANIVPGLPIPYSSDLFKLATVHQLNSYAVPDYVRELVAANLRTNDSLSTVQQENLRTVKALLYQPLSQENHVDKLQLLLHIEECQLEEDMRRYDLSNVTLEMHRHNLLSLKVPGLVEGRPSLRKGDELFVSGFANKEYQGIVHDVLLESVVVGFEDKFCQEVLEANVNGGLSVRFCVGRYPLRVQYRALELAKELSLYPMLFPSKTQLGFCKPMTALRGPLKFYDSKLEKNPEQAQAVKQILLGSSRPAPYLLFGPPGTGKTVTIIEAIKQIRKCIPNAHVLACAPSNTAADLIAERLLVDLKQNLDVFRMHASSRLPHTIPKKIKHISNLRDGAIIEFPTKEFISKFRVVVTTLTTAGRLVSANFNAGHFTHVFIDEAGQAGEPESLVAIAGIHERLNKGVVVLTGDPQQLGPVHYSPIARRHGLSTSLLERLMTTCEIYQRDADEKFNPSVITKLLHNYRSHAHILEIPNRLFYEHELIKSGSPAVTDSLVNWEGLVKKGSPVIFHGVCGEDMREARSPSWFNPAEISMVKYYVDQLLGGNSCKVKPKDIGIISPYQKQCQKIKEVLQVHAPGSPYEGVTVGSAEEFQGCERKIIVLSAVRSNPDLLATDAELQLGFLRNPKRFNTALTRAQALLIIIGDPHVLQKDRYWNSLLTYCQKNGTYRGVEFEHVDDESFEKFWDKLSNLRHECKDLYELFKNAKFQ